MHIASACNFFCNFYHSITFQLLVYRYFLHSFISKLSILMYCENEHLNPSAKHEQCSFQIVMQGHSLDWIPWCIFFFLLRGILCLAWNFLLSVQKRKAEIALNSFMMESEDGTMVFKWLVCQKIPLHIFYSLLWKKFSLRKPCSIFQFLHR